MSRISAATRNLYTPKIREGGNEDQCYFCGEGASMEDFTPAPSASKIDLDRFHDPYIRVKACNRCWRRIYTVNIAEFGRRFNVPRGCMTIQQKEILLGSDNVKKAIEEAASKYAFAFDPPFVAPMGLMEMGDNKFLWNTTTVYRDELESLQGPLSLQMIGANKRYVEISLLQGITSGDLSGDRIDIYRNIVGLPSQEEMIHGTTD